MRFEQQVRKYRLAIENRWLALLGIQGLAIS